ncbi:TRAP transporter small permease [Motiliproteus sp. MSK22-1]|uniref:TRAP transporter small permease n=1 Tax=Motiliproteus sp. MSK22-1 TaxID=1897630 RepID=UPI0009774A8C|nr:TRAP transporter small permease [Motiliproteus sp. MSK22-1]OMH38885.1 C4-dicarboxylate ABC transporter permease [Motiliproteus sp. MSK22-1]
MLRNLINSVEEGFLSLLLISMVLLVFVEVLMRFVFNSGIHWAQELTLLLSAWFVLFGASYGVRVGAHIGVDVFVRMLPRPIHRQLSLLAIILCLFYCGLFLLGSWSYLSKLVLIGIELEDLPVPAWVASSVLLIGFTLLLFRFLTLGWNIAQGRSEGFQLADEAKTSMAIADELSADYQHSSEAAIPQERK